MTKFRYGAVLDDAWNGLWRQWGMWRFGVMGMLAILVVYGLPAIAFTLAWIASSQTHSALYLVLGIVIAAIGLVGLIGVATALMAGMLSLADGAMSGGNPPVCYGFAKLGASFWRVLGFYAALIAIVYGVAAVIVGILALAIVPLLGAGGLESDAAAFGVAIGAVIGYAAFLVVLTAFAVLAAPFAMTGLCAIVVDKATVRGAFRQGWWAIRHRFVPSVLTSMMIICISYGFSFVISMLIEGFAFLAMVPAFALIDPGKPDAPAFYVALAVVLLLIIAVALVASVPTLVFMILGWMSFYRQLTGRRTPAFEPEPATGPSA